MGGRGGSIWRVKTYPGEYNLNEKFKFPALLHMSRNEFNELSSCEVRRLNQFRTANLIQMGSAIFPAWLSRAKWLWTGFDSYINYNKSTIFFSHNMLQCIDFGV